MLSAIFLFGPGDRSEVSYGPRDRSESNRGLPCAASPLALLASSALGRGAWAKPPSAADLPLKARPAAGSGGRRCGTGPGSTPAAMSGAGWSPQGVARLCLRRVDESGAQLRRLLTAVGDTVATAARTTRSGALGRRSRPGSMCSPDPVAGAAASKRSTAGRELKGDHQDTFSAGS